MDKDNKNNNEEKSSFIKIKKEDQRILLVAIIMIAFLIFMSYDRINNISSIETRTNHTKEQDAPLINIPSLEELTSSEYLEDIMKEIGIEEDTSKDTYITHIIENEFQFSYPSSWSVINIDQRNINNIDGAEAIFMAYSKNIARQGNILVLKIDAKTTEEAIEKLEKIAEDEEEEIEIRQIEDFVLEIERITSEQIVPFSWQKIIFTNKNCYLLSLNFSIENKEYFRETKDRLFSSVKIIEK